MPPSGRSRSTDRALAVLGSTGSVGRAALQVASLLRLRVAALAGGADLSLLAEQILDTEAALVCVRRTEDVSELTRRLAARGGDHRPEVVWGDEGLKRIATDERVGTVVVALDSSAGLPAAVAAVRCGKDLALATKEIAVAGGPLLRSLAGADGPSCVPVDSELTAVHQLLRVHPADSIERVVLCASGGPFWGQDPDRLERVTPADALKHPVWRMGPKVTVDSATMMNKGLEIMAASLLLGIAPCRLDAVAHPQCRVHAMVELVDGTVRAHLAEADMHWALGYALSFPDPVGRSLAPLDLTGLGRLEFEPVDRSRFPCLALAERAVGLGGLVPCALSAADEVAVHAFLSGRIGFMDIVRCLEAVLEHAEKKALASDPPSGVEAIMAADRWARDRAAEWVRRSNR